MAYHVSFDIDFKRNIYPGKFVVVEGIDGSGKTTQIKNLEKELLKKGYKVFSSKNPTDGAVGKFIREILAGKKKFSPVAFQYLFCADRAEQQKEIIARLKQGELVLMDRYFWSSVAYGAVDNGIDFSKRKNPDRSVFLVAFSILSVYSQFIVPDVTVYLKVPAQTAISRLRESRHSLDIYDKKEKLEKIAGGYDWLVKKFPKEFLLIDGEKEEKEVAGEILEKLKNL